LYVDGQLCINPENCTLSTQPFAPVPGTPRQLDPNGEFFWLEAWDRYVAPEMRMDEAGAPHEASGRSQSAWRIRSASLAQARARSEQTRLALQRRRAWSGVDVATTDSRIAALDAADAKIERALKALARPRTRARKMAGDALLRAFDLCPPLLAVRTIGSGSHPPADSVGGYTGGENRLYRVEVHRGGLAGSGASFKWSRLNGSALYPFKGVTGSSPDPTLAKVELLDSSTGDLPQLREGDWLEPTSRGFELEERAPSLLRIRRIDLQTREVELQAPTGVTADLGAASFLRGWDHKSGVDHTGALPIVEHGDPVEGWIYLEGGISIQFAPGGLYRTGDYWVIPAIASTGSVAWPPAVGGSSAHVPPITWPKATMSLAYAWRSNAGWCIDNED
jgi:hypothetical protein